MNARVLGLFLVISLPLNAGCIIPLAIVPVPSVGNGEEVVFRDEKGDAVQADGMLIVSRTRYHRFFGAGFYEVPSNQVVVVRDGKTKLPSDVFLLTVGLTLNEFAIGITLEGLICDPQHVPPLALLSLPGLLIPLPVVTPTENLYIVPLLEGYHPIKWSGVRPFLDSDNGYTPSAVGGHDVLCANANDPEEAKAYWTAVRERLRRRHEERKFKDLPDLRLEYYHYNKVSPFIDAELKRIASLRVTKTADDD